MPEFFLSFHWRNKSTAFTILLYLETLYLYWIIMWQFRFSRAEQKIRCWMHVKYFITLRYKTLGGDLVIHVLKSTPCSFHFFIVECTYVCIKRWKKTETMWCSFEFWFGTWEAKSPSSVLVPKMIRYSMCIQRWKNYVVL